MIEINLAPWHCCPFRPRPRKTKDNNRVDHSGKRGVCCVVFAVFDEERTARLVREPTFNGENAALKDHAEQQWLDSTVHMEQLAKTATKDGFRHLEIEISRQHPCTQEKGHVDTVGGKPLPAKATSIRCGRIRPAWANSFSILEKAAS